MRQLNFGCGEDVRPASDGWVNLDVVKLPGVDVVHDMNRFPYPFRDGEFDHVLARHVLEHVPHHLTGHSKDGLLLVMEEFHRILRPGGTVEVVCPHYKADTAWMDPTHTRVVHPDTFSYFEPNGKWSFYSDARFELVERTIPRYVARAHRFLPLGPRRVGLFEHLLIRAPWLGPIVRRPHEMRWLLRAVKGRG